MPTPNSISISAARFSVSPGLIGNDADAEPLTPAKARALVTVAISASDTDTHDARKADVDREFRARAALSNCSRLKRALDILGALAGLIALGPFLLLVALLIRLESPGPAIFRQQRTGRGGVVFNIYKFRSMRVLEDGAQVKQASKGDTRITPLGAFLRRSCVDELPQLLNVLKGEMSLVGPRPHAVAHDEYYATQIPRYRDRFLVRPGIAGLAQVSGLRGATPTIECMAARVASDCEYIAAWSFALDVQILLRAVTDGPFHPSAF